MKCDVAVVIQTVCRKSLLRAVRSVYRQDFPGSIHLLVGIDADPTTSKDRQIALLQAEKPANVVLTVVDLGYSSSQRYGGIHSCRFGGSLRSILTLAASAPYIAYLDDDDWYLPGHLRLLLAAAEGKPWAFSLCWYADSDASKPLYPDTIESVGPERGVFAGTFRGFVRPSALMVEALGFLPYAYRWSQALNSTGDGEDRLIFDVLRQIPGYGETGVAPVCYSIDPKDSNHAVRAEFLKQNGVDVAGITKRESVRG